ncbi:MULTISPECIES: LCP family protein [Enterococcus]|uniref:Regulatory protein MsrR n=1 Tax=Enterococcus alcedinis TaxID=1274384 RepID=A0A917N5K7_9ENTE|nr:LCP family protein [Enterococcus alcedinis]GGI64807.1 transcriptional regulator [Enterococcus alcedinis]
MSRMERFRDVHEELNKQEAKTKKNPYSRKKQQIVEEDKWEEEVVYYEDNEYEDSTPPPQQKKQNGIFNQNKPKKVKKRKRRGCFGRLFFILTLFILFIGGSFVFGKIAGKVVDSTSEPEAFNGFTASNQANNILLIGNDSREGETARADTIMVLQLDGPAKKPKLVSFMRDTYVSIPGYGENKINASYAFGGAELVRQTLSQNFGIETKYYAVVDFQDFSKVIDTLFSGGVAIDAEKDMSTYLDVPITKGPQKMDGHTLLQYARFRMDEEGDFGRVRRQQQVMNAIFSQLKNPVNAIKLPYAAGKTLGFTATNLPTTFLLRNSLNILKGSSGIDRLTVPVENSWSYGESYEAGSVLLVDYEVNRQEIERFWGN